MLLKIVSPQGIIFEGKVEKVQIPTDVGLIGISPNHTPFSSIVIPGITKILPTEKKWSEVLSSAEFLFEQDEINISLGQGIVYLDGSTILMLVSSATTNPKTDKQTLEDMKKQLEEKIAEIKVKWDIEEIEKAYLSLQKLTSDLKLLKLKKH